MCSEAQESVWVCGSECALLIYYMYNLEQNRVSFEEIRVVAQGLTRPLRAPRAVGCEAALPCSTEAVTVQLIMVLKTGILCHFLMS